MDLLYSRAAEDVTKWLKEFPNIKLLTRDSSYTYDKAIRDANSDILQEADRFHLLKNVTDSANKELKKTMPNKFKISCDMGQKSIEEVEFTEDDLLDEQKQNYLNKKKIIEEVKKMYEKCHNYSKVAKELELNRKTVKKYVNLEKLPIQIRTQIVDLDSYKGLIIKNINKKTSEIYNILKENGYKKSYNSLNHYIKVKNLKISKEEHCPANETVVITRQEIEKLLFNKSIKDITEDSKKQKAIIYFLKNNPKIQNLIECVMEFRIAIFSTDTEKIIQWIEKVNNSETSNYISTKNIQKELDAVLNNIQYPEYSNGLVEGKNTKVKYIKRSMFGRCGFDLLRKKVLARP